MSFGKRYDDNLSAPTLNFVRADDRVHGIIPALDDDVGPECLYQLQRGVFIEQNDEIDCLEPGQDVSTISLIAHRPSWSLEPPHRAVGIDPYDQCVTARARGAQQIHMTPVQQIENPVGENDFSGEALPASNRVLARRRDLVGG